MICVWWKSPVDHFKPTWQIRKMLTFLPVCVIISFSPSSMNLTSSHKSPKPVGLVVKWLRPIICNKTCFLLMSWTWRNSVKLFLVKTSDELSTVKIQLIIHEKHVLRRARIRWGEIKWLQFLRAAYPFRSVTTWFQ